MSEPENATAHPPAPKALVRKLCEVMAQLDRVPKRGRNEHFGYDFATESDITEALRKHLAEKGIMIFPHVDLVEQGEPFLTSGGSQQWITTVWMTFSFVDAESGEVWAVRWPGQGQDGSDKAIYKAITGALKFLLLKTFLISTGEATDPETDTRQDQRAAATASTPPPNAKPDNLQQQALQLVDLIQRLCALDRTLAPDGIIGSYFKTKAGKALTWAEVRDFHTPKQFKWVIGGIAAIRKQYQALLAEHPEDESQQPDIPF